MAKLIGRERAAGLGKESVYGTAVAPTHWIPFQEFTINDRKDVLTDNSGTGTRNDTLATDVNYKYSDGNINGIIYPNTFGMIALAAFGRVTTANHPTATGVKVHTFDFADTLPSFTIASEDKNEEVRYPGAVLNELTISAQTGSYATFTSSWLGRQSSPSTVTPAFTQETRFRPQDVKLYFADTVANLDSATKFCATDFTFTIGNNISPTFCLGTQDPEYDPGVLGLDLTLNKTYVNTSFKDMVMGTDPKAFRIEMVRSDVSIGTVTPTNPSVVIDFEPGLFTDWSREGGLDDMLTEAINYKPLRSFTTGKALSMKITNTETSY